MPGGCKSLRRVSREHVQAVRRISGDGGPTMWRGDRLSVVPRKWVERVKAERGVEVGRRRGSVL
jgi:hypothetical protein